MQTATAFGNRLNYREMKYMFLFQTMTHYSLLGSASAPSFGCLFDIAKYESLPNQQLLKIK